VQDRRPRDVGSLSGIRFGGAMRDLVSLDGDVDQAAEGL